MHSSKASGAIGSRCRNGWGSFQVVTGGLRVEQTSACLKKHTRDWRKGFVVDYPNCLGGDEKGSLLWKTKPKASWAESMGELAYAYANLRAGTVGDIAKLNPGSNNGADERHLLGVPLFHHPAWGSSARHASPLRFVVHRKEGEASRLCPPFLTNIVFRCGFLNILTKSKYGKRSIGNWTFC